MMKKTKIILYIILITGLLAGVVAYILYQSIYKPNINIEGKEYDYLYIPTGTNYDELIGLLDATGYVVNIRSFKQLANLKSFSNVKSGRYRICNKMNNNALIGMLRIGDQTPVNITFNNVRTLQQLAGKIAEKIELDSLSLLKTFLNSHIQKKYGFNQHTFIAMFLANTYEVFWDISSEDLVQRMANEYKIFWTKERKEKAQKLGLSQSEVATLSSIVQLESLKPDEYSKIAGVYINRLKKGMLLQADPTVIYAIGDFSIRRVLKHQLKYPSPYNTYVHKGLPPGPIYLTSATLIDAVLNYQNHNYLYFCAKDDFSGYHSFSSNYLGHISNARKYQRALSRRKIYN